MKVYGQMCPLARTAEIIGERWTLLILRALLYGSQSFNSLRKSMSGISPTILSGRLRSLEIVGIIGRDENAGGVSYRLQPAGEALRPILMSLGDWGSRYTEAVHADVDMGHILWEMSRRTNTDLFDPNETVVFGFDLECEETWVFNLVIHQGEARIEMKQKLNPLVTVHSDARTFSLIWHGELTFDEAMEDNGLILEGEPQEAERLTRCLGLGLFSGDLTK